MKSAIKKFNHWPLAGLMAAFILLAALFSLTVPLDAAPDEREHFDLIRYIAEQKRPPLNNAEREAVGYKGDASPIYHSLVALFSQYVDVEPLPRLHTLSVPEVFIPFDTILNNRTFHTQNENFPFRGIVLAWHLARLATIPMAAATMVAIYLTVLVIYPTRPYLALAAAAFAAFLPRFTINSAVLNDDNLVIPFTAFAVYFLVRVLQGDVRRRTLMWLGVCIGLATITKYHALVLLPEMSAAFAVMAWVEQKRWQLWLRRWSWAMLGFLVSAGAWLAFLVIRFNRMAELGLIRGLLDPLGDPVIRDSSGLSLTWQGLAWDWIGPLYRSFWLALEGTRLFAPEPVYWLFGLVSLAALAGLLKWLADGFKHKHLWQPGIVLLALHFFIYLAIVFVRYQTRAAMGLGYAAAPHNIQGRHLYPALISVAFFFVLGLTEALRAWPWFTAKVQLARFSADKVAAIGVSSLFVGLGLVSFFYYMRPTYLPYLPILNLEPENAPVTHPVKTRLAKGINLIGYNFDAPDNGVLPVTLYWQARLEQERDYLIELCLADAAGQSVACKPGHPANGLFPTRSWTAGHLIKDEITLPLPRCLPAGDYELTLSAYLLRDDAASTVIERIETGPVSLGHINLSQDTSPVPAKPELCTSTGCQSGVQLTIAQIRQGLSVVDYTHAEAVRLVGNMAVWSPLEKPVAYQCPNGPLTTINTFMADRAVAPGSYQLEVGGQVQPNMQVTVKTHPRQFNPPATIQHPLDISYAGLLELLGYNVDLSPRYAGEPIEATLFWRAQRTTDKNYVATLHLLDNQLTMWGQTDHEAGGLYPNILWAPGEVVADVHTLQNPAIPPGLYTIELVLYDSSQGFQPLPKVQRSTGEFMPHNPVLGQIRLMDPARRQPPNQPMPITLNDEIHFLGYDLERAKVAKGQTLSFALHWQALKPPATDYTVFTQLIGPDGLVWAQKDNPPQAGRYPTTLWPVADRVVDRYELLVPENAPAGDYRLLVGMYNWATGERLPAFTDSGNVLPDNAIQLTTITVEHAPGMLP